MFLRVKLNIVSLSIQINRYLSVSVAIYVAWLTFPVSISLEFAFSGQVHDALESKTEVFIDHAKLIFVSRKQSRNVLIK